MQGESSITTDEFRCNGITSTGFEGVSKGTRCGTRGNHIYKGKRYCKTHLKKAIANDRRTPPKKR